MLCLPHRHGVVWSGFTGYEIVSFLPLWQKNYSVTSPVIAEQENIKNVTKLPKQFKTCMEVGISKTTEFRYLWIIQNRCMKKRWNKKSHHHNKGRKKPNAGIIIYNDEEIWIECCTEVQCWCWCRYVARSQRHRSKANHNSESCHGVMAQISQIN